MKIAKVYLFWILTSLLLVFSSVLWFHRESIHNPVGIDVVVYELLLIENRFGFPVNFLYIGYMINGTNPQFVERTTAFSPLAFTVDFLCYFAILSIPILIAKEQISSRHTAQRHDLPTSENA
jgi:hypothetical protein